MPSLEIEVKFYLGTDREDVRRRILGLGCESKSRVFEHNLCFENEDGTLATNRSLLRLRKTDHLTTLTLKTTPPSETMDAKIREEREVCVSDYASMKHILECLGFYSDRVYEKRREYFSGQEVVFCLDTLPFGDFLEIEGPLPAIHAAADLLGLSWDRRILKSYLGIFDRVRSHLHLPFRDIIFDHFISLPEDLGDIISSFEACRMAP